MKVSERHKLNVFEMTCLRSTAGVSRFNRFSNEEVRESSCEERIGGRSGYECSEVVWSCREDGK